MPSPSASESPEPSRGSTRPAAAPDLARVLEVVRSVVVDVSDGRGLGQLGPDVSFERELGLGSLERVELGVRAEAAFGLRLPTEAFGLVDTPRALLALVEQQGARAPAAAASPTGDRASLLPREPPGPRPTEAQSLVEVLEHHLRIQPERVHIVLEDDDGSTLCITHRRLHEAASAVAAGLRARGLSPGAKVAIMLPTSLGYFAAFMGALMAGGVPVPLYPPMRLDRIAEYIGRCTNILDNAQAQILVTFDRAARVADIARDRVAAVQHVLAIETLLPAAGTLSLHGSAARAAIASQDTALIQYTSGSTGDPKGVELTHAAVLANIRASAAGCGLMPTDVLVSWLPLYHDMGLIAGWLMPLFAGVPVVLCSPLLFLTRPAWWLRALSDYRATCSVAPNFAFDLCVKRIDDAELAGLQLAQVRAILNGSEPILPGTLDRFATRFGAVGLRREALFCAYGLAENMVAVAFAPLHRVPRIDRIDRSRFEQDGVAVPVQGQAAALEFVGVGFAVPGHELQVVDDRGEPVPPRTRGVVRFRGPSTFKGYYRRAEATAAVKREGGWVDTGDLGYRAEDGELFIVGRVKDIIIKGGRNYYPHEIEEAAATVAGIRQGCVAAFAVRDESAGTEQIVVVAESRERDPTAREILVGRAVEAITARVGVPPDRVELVPPGAVPKTSSGKIQRNATRQRYLGGTLAARHGSFARQAAGLLLGSVPARLGQAARAIGRTLFGLWAGLVIGLGCAAALVIGRVVPAGATARRVIAWQARAVLTLAGLRPHVSGLSQLPAGAAILVGNHCGYLDFLVCGAALPPDVRFVIKGELRDAPLLGPVLRKLGHVFLDRHSTQRSLADLDEVVSLLREGHKVVLFPEGTFSPEVGLRSFKLGAFRLALHTGTPLLPFGIVGSRRALRDGTWLPRPARIAVRMAAPIEVPPRPEPQAEIAVIVALRDRTAEAVAGLIDEPRLFAAEIAVPGGRADEAAG